jgi:hypothetical protein
VRRCSCQSLSVGANCESVEWIKQLCCCLHWLYFYSPNLGK